jgi:hypothetical protein
MTRTPRILLAAMALAVAAAACDKGGGGAAGANPTDSLYKQSDGADNLKGLMEAIVAANGAGDHKKAAALTRGLLPDEAALKKALRDDAPAALRDAAKAMTAGMPTDDAQVAGLIKPGDPARTQVNVHAATTEEIVKYEEGGAAYSEFPGGARKLAEQGLRPGVTFYEVEFVEPGKDAGMKYHMFFFDGARWRMLGPAWRALR